MENFQRFNNEVKPQWMTLRYVSTQHTVDECVNTTFTAINTLLTPKHKTIPLH